MDSKQIEKVLWGDKWTQKGFIGCFPADQIPSTITKYPCSIIINLDSTNKNPETHWIAAYCENESTVYYFDCFGSLNCIYSPFLKPSPYILCGPNAAIYDFLNRFDSVITNKFIYQSLFANNSAHYSIYFIHAMSIGIPFNKIVSILDKHQDPNNFVLNFVYNIAN